MKAYKGGRGPERGWPIRTAVHGWFRQDPPGRGWKAE